MHVSGPLPLFNSLAPGFLLFFFDTLESDAVHTDVALTLRRSWPGAGTVARSCRPDRCRSVAATCMRARWLGHGNHLADYENLQFLECIPKSLHSVT